jgi:bifunctional non-homologous end joining protein LigD
VFFRFIEPCQPTLRPLPPTGPRWSHEVKFDGGRLQIHKVGRPCRLYSRRGHDVSASFPTVAAAALAVPARTLICDAELVACTT